MLKRRVSGGVAWAVVLLGVPLSCSTAAVDDNLDAAGVTPSFCGTGAIQCAGGDTCPAHSSCESGGCPCDAGYAAFTCDGIACTGSGCPIGGYFCAVASRGFPCPKGTSPCGDGCIPNATAVCCDNGSGATSSYCTNSAGGGCFSNTMQCAAAFPSGTNAQFCCAANGTVGSNDCPTGQHHCGLQCYPADHACCPAGSSSADCPETSWDPSSCTLPAPTDVGCAVCLSNNMCLSCASGECCAGDPCNGGQCLPSAVCVGNGGGTHGDDGGADEGGSDDDDGSDDAGATCAGGLVVSTLECDPLGSSGASPYCLTASEYTSATGMPLPSACAPEGTTGCEGESGSLAGILVNPCCPGLTCRISSACGDPTDAVGGTCKP